MTCEEFSNQFDVLFNNITSNQAPGLNEYEKSVFLTKAQDEVVKNYFSANSKGNMLQQGFDDSAKRQADFSGLMKTQVCTSITNPHIPKLNKNSKLFKFPTDLFIAINEQVQATDEYKHQLQVIPLRYDEYTRLMSKPFQRPCKNQVWRLMSQSQTSGDNKSVTVELIPSTNYDIASYTIRYIHTLDPIILIDLEDGLSINGKSEKTECKLDSSLHEQVLQRAIELAKGAWVADANHSNYETTVANGQRSE